MTQPDASKVTTPKILSAEEFSLLICSAGDKDIRKQLKDSHAAQAERIQELEQSVSELNSFDVPLELFNERQRNHELTAERNAALQRAEAAEEYKTSVNAALDHVIKKYPSLDHEWGGDRTGWGFALEWIKWVAERAMTAEDLLRQIREVLPAKRARELSNIYLGKPGEVELAAFAALVEEKP